MIQSWLLKTLVNTNTDLNQAHITQFNEKEHASQSTIKGILDLLYNYADFLCQK